MPSLATATRADVAAAANKGPRALHPVSQSPQHGSELACKGRLTKRPQSLTRSRLTVTYTACNTPAYGLSPFVRPISVTLTLSGSLWHCDTFWLAVKIIQVFFLTTTKITEKVPVSFFFFFCRCPTSGLSSDDETAYFIACLWRESLSLLWWNAEGWLKCCCRTPEGCRRFCVDRLVRGCIIAMTQCW